MKLTDSVSGELLGEAVDKQAGGMGLKGAASFQWGDAQNAMDYWAQKISTRLLRVTRPERRQLAFEFGD